MYRDSQWAADIESTRPAGVPTISPAQTDIQVSRFAQPSRLGLVYHSVQPLGGRQVVNSGKRGSLPLNFHREIWEDGDQLVIEVNMSYQLLQRCTCWQGGGRSGV